LYLTSGKSSIEDLDFAKAISAFEQSKIALQAAQQTFTQVQGLTLFNYI
jgi:flagellar hook-associated protein 3 FlgL